MINLAPYPFIRIFIPMAMGILFFDMGVYAGIMYAIPILSIALYAMIKYNKSPYFQYKHSYVYNISLFGIILFTGWLCAYFHQPATLPDFAINKEIVFSFQIEDIDQNNTTTDLIGEATIDQQKIKLLASLKGNKYDLQVGDILYCKSRINRITNVSIPEAFDYATFMMHKGILYRCYIDSPTNYYIALHENTLRSQAEKLKKTLIQQIRKLELNKEATNFIITIFTGDKKFIDTDTRNVFSNAGIAHLLAVSGLHILMLSLILGLLLRPLIWINCRKLSFILLIIAVWGFTYFTGMSASAIRASIMTTLLFSAILIHRKYSIINSLFISATIIVIFSPHSLFDLGFQLSYSAVLGIICFAKKFTFGNKGSVVRKISEVLAVTIAAQLGTFLLILYYFNSLSLSFFISNLVIIPILPLFIIFVLITLIISSLGILVIPFSSLIDIMYNIFNAIAGFSSQIPYTQFTDLYINGYSTFALFIGILCFAIWLTHRQIIFLRATTILLFIGCSFMIIDTIMIPTHGIFIASDYTSTNIVYYNNKQAYVINERNDKKEAADFLERNRKFFIKHRINEIAILDKDFKSQNLLYKRPMLYVQGKRIIIASGNINKTYTTDSRLKTDYLIISSSYYNDVESLVNHFETQKVILPMNSYEKKKSNIISGLVEHNIPYLDLSKDIFWIEFN